MQIEEKFRIIGERLSPERPIRTYELLRGRTADLEKIVRELRYFHAAAFIYGHRGVGKTSLARTAAQLITNSDCEHPYVACAPGSRMLDIMREIGEQLLKIIFKSGAIKNIKKEVELEISLNPAIRASFKKQAPELQRFEDVNAAVRVLKELDTLIPNPRETVIVVDELEELEDNDRSDLAFLIKQLGDQEFQLRFILVGIAENVHELIGAHESVPRYLKEVSLTPLDPQDLMDIVSNAAAAVEIEVPRDILLRIAVVGNGLPHFAHLMGKALLVEAISDDQPRITNAVYKAGVTNAVADSYQELRISYEAATQRGKDYFKHLIWALAHSDIVDVRIDQWIEIYKELARKLHWSLASEKALKSAINNFKSESYGSIIVNTPARYGSSEMRYRYKRFSNTLMRGHVRLQAENEGVTLAELPNL